MNRNAKLFFGILLAVALLLPVGCGQKSGKKLAFVTNNASDFWTIARKGTEKADEELADATVEFKIPADGTAAEQKRIIDDLLAKGIDGIAISPVDPANQTELINQTAKQALIVTQDSDAPNSQRAVYVGTDNVAAGRQAGQLLKQALPEGGKIVVFVGKLDAQNAKERLQGIKEEIAGTKIEILDTRTDDADHTRAKANAADSLVKYPEAAAFVGLWSYNGPAILNAIKEAGKVGKVKIVCFDEEDQTLAGVKAGEIVARPNTTTPSTFNSGTSKIVFLSALTCKRSSVLPIKDSA